MNKWLQQKADVKMLELGDRINQSIEVRSKDKVDIKEIEKFCNKSYRAHQIRMWLGKRQRTLKLI